MMFESSCAGCERPGPVLCTTCRMALLAPPPTGLPDGVIAVLPYSGRVRQIVLGLKYRNRRRVARHLGGLLVNRLVRLGRHRSFDVVTWAPTTTARRRGRGFDQAEVIADTVARQLGVPCRRLLDRRGADAAQTGRSRAERLDRPVFDAHPRIDHRRVLVVDDVVTTGATLQAAADALEDAGASVLLAAVAATPDVRPASVLPLAPAGPAPAEERVA